MGVITVVYIIQILYFCGITQQDMPNVKEKSKL